MTTIAIPRGGNLTSTINRDPLTLTDLAQNWHSCLFLPKESSQGVGEEGVIFTP